MDACRTRRRYFMFWIMAGAALSRSTAFLPTARPLLGHCLASTTNQVDGPGGIQWTHQQRRQQRQRQEQQQYQQHHHQRCSSGGGAAIDIRRWGRHASRRGCNLIMQAEERNLFDCIRDEDMDALRTYIEGGGPVHVADTLGDTSLLVAASTGNVELVKLLASAKDADINYPCFHGGETPLMAAVTQGHLGVVQYLAIEAGANVNAMNHRGDTALSLAAFWGKVDCVKFLLSVPSIDTEIHNIQGKRAGEGMQELMRDDTNDDETIALIRQSRVDQGIE